MIKRAFVRALTAPWAAPLLAPLVRGTGTVFMFHRFRDPELGSDGHDPAFVRAMLATLRRSRRELTSVDAIAAGAREGGLGGRSPVAFTVDDGYADFATTGASTFAEFDCPVTVFVVSGVLDGLSWYWWDRITAALEASPLRELTVTIDGAPQRLAWASAEERARAGTWLMERLKLVGDDERHAVLNWLPEALRIELPDRPPRRFAPMAWNDVRDCATRGATFGAHTVTHPVLSRVSAAAARQEVATSWRRLREETTATTPVFCYPNGRPQDIGAGSARMLRDLGFTSAVTTTRGYVDGSLEAKHPDAAFHLPRFAWPDTPSEYTQIVNGVERAKLAIRRER
jgi:peptidoglycan/xylan/chitin deacetylase (PgdA/CDA1 family)